MNQIAARPKPRVFALYDLDQTVRDHASQHFDLTCPGEPGWEEWREKAEGIMVRAENITSEDVKRFGNQLQFVCKHGVGLDQLDMLALKERNVVVMNTPGINAGAVAELAFALALALSRNIAAIDRKIRDGVVVNKDDEGAVGFQMQGRTLGLIGGGNIGHRLAVMFYGAFQSKIVLYDPYLKAGEMKRWTDAFASNDLSIVDSVDEVASQADVLSLHVPLLNSTRGLIAGPQLRLMRRDAILVNTARGGVVDEEALATALEQGWIAGAGIDAYSEEPPTLTTSGRLVRQERVISTPHIGAASLDVIRKNGFAVVDHLRDAFAGSPRNVCSL